MRQLWPGAAETGVTASSSSTSAARAPGFFLSLAILLWAFLSILAEAVQPGAGGPRSIDPDHIEFVSEHETGPPSRNPKALATVVPRDGDLVVRSEKPRSTGISGGLVPHTIGQRSLKDFEVEDWVLVATVDGGLTARERKTGIPLWNFTLEEPVVRTVYHRANMSAHERDGTDHATWIVGPSENGELYQFTYEHGLEKFDYTIKDIVEYSPYSPAGFDEVYNGEKKTTVYIVNPELGTVTKYFGTGGMHGNIPKKNCAPRSGVQQPECQVPDKPDREERSHDRILIARTEYTIGIHSRSTGEPIWTIKYNQWGPNNSDRDLLSQYRRSIDDRYILSRHDGWIYGFDGSNGSPDGGPSWQYELSSQAVVTFDVIRSLHDPEAGLLILNQPVTPKGGVADGLAAWVGCTPEGGFFAMSEMRFPLVTSGSEKAGCYKEDLRDWPSLDIPKRQKLLVGKHEVRYTPAEHTQHTYRPGIAAPSGYSENQNRDRQDRERQNREGHYETNASPPFSQPDTNPSDRASTLTKTVTQHPKIISAVAIFSLLGLFFTNSLATAGAKSFLRSHGLQNTLQVATEVIENHLPNIHLDTQPEPSPAASNAVVQPETENPETEKPKKPTVSFAEEPKVDPVTDGEELNGATPKKKKAHRGKRGGAGRKKNNAAKDASDKASDESSKEPPNVAQPDTNLTMLADGHVQKVVPSSHATLNNLTINTDKVLGTGSQGTIVYEGMWEGKPVAVKQIPTVFMDVAEHEVKLLQESDYHPNVVRYYCRQQQWNNIYIALEKCPGSLYDLFAKVETEEFKRLRQEMDRDVRDALLQITKGLDHLHSVKVVHRDIKPQNILVGAPNFPNPKDPKSYRPRMLISDFGLCKKLQTDEYSFGVTTAHNAGTVGWRAPELLREWDPKTQPKPADQENSNGTNGTGSGTDVILDAHTKRRATKAIDIFALGCVFYFVLSNGGHPFGERIEREYNIIQGKSDLSLLNDFSDDGVFEASDLISSMIQKNPKLRPDTRRVATHPFFWEPLKSLDFLTDVSDRFEVEKDHEKNDPDYNSPFIPLLESEIKDEIIDGDWIRQMERHFHSELFATKRRGYDGTRILDLLRAIRNKKNHYQDMQPEAQAAVGSLPKGYLSYFTRRFPRLLMHTYNVVCAAGFDEEPRFQRYFTLSTW